jgi:hypothetical protein
VFYSVKVRVRPTDAIGGSTSRSWVITERTADTHVERIFDKLGFSARAQVAAWIAEHRLNLGDTKN